MTDFSAFRDDAYRLIGAAMEVHRELGSGLLEAIYQEALAYELSLRQIPNERERLINAYYKGHLLAKQYKADLVAGDILIELKTVGAIGSEHRAQLCNYLRLTRKPLGLLLNFAAPKLYGERWGYDVENNTCYKLDRNLHPIDPLT